MLTRAQLKDLRDLRRREGRREQVRFLAEGVRVLEESLHHGRRPELVLRTPDKAGPRTEALVAVLIQAGVPVHELASSDLCRIADARTPQAILGVFALPENESLEPAREPLAVFDGIADPGNLGTLIRSALAFGCPRVVCCGDSADPFAPKVVRSTAGALFGVGVARRPAAEVAEALESAGVALIAATVDGAQGSARLDELVATGPVAVAVGSEREGLGETLRAAARLRWRIGHDPAVESLNAGIAGSILLREVYEARARVGRD